MLKTPKKIVVGLSGGVDSAVTALLLKQQGHEVIGVTMQNWEIDNDDPYCNAEQDISDAYEVSKTIGIPFQTINFAKQYWQNVFQYCLDEFSKGRTPNPDIWCNKEIKFKVFLEHAKALGADYLATGHYVQSHFNDDNYQMLKGADLNKDQSYFLYTLGQKELAQAIFPIGQLPKSEVRKIALQQKLPVATKKDSTGICFIGERKFKEFLSEFLLAQPGEMQTPDGKTIGTHDGLMYYTLGQRKGLQIGGLKNADEQPWFVVDKDVANNILIIAQGHDHPLLYKTELTCSDLHWVSGNAPKTPIKLTAKTRYRQTDQPCQLMQLEKDQFNVIFENAQRAITPGQSVVFYQHNVCLGGGIIR